jgi:hypothetical protein
MMGVLRLREDFGGVEFFIFQHFVSLTVAYVSL